MKTKSGISQPGNETRNAKRRQGGEKLHDVQLIDDPPQSVKRFKKMFGKNANSARGFE